MPKASKQGSSKKTKKSYETSSSSERARGLSHPKDVRDSAQKASGSSVKKDPLIYDEEDGEVVEERLSLASELWENDPPVDCKSFLPVNRPFTIKPYNADKH